MLSKPSPSPPRRRRKTPKRRTTAKLAAFLVLAVGLHAAAAQAIEGTVEFPKDTVSLGDPIPLTLKFTAPAGQRLGPVLWALPADSLAERTKPTLAVRHDSLYQVTAELAPFALGDLNVSPDRLLLYSSEGDSLEVTFPARTVTVESVLPASADSIQPADYKPIIEPPMEIPLWAWLILIVAALAVGLWLWLKRRPKHVKPEAVTPKRPPWEIALERLDALESKGYHSRGEPRLFAIDLSEIVRQYLELRFGFEALEQTTSEIKAALTHTELSDDQRQTLLETLSGCDLAKYAKFHWPVPELEKSLSLARTFVNDTIPQPTPEEAAA